MRNENMSFVHVTQIRPGAATAVDSRGQHRPPLLPRHQPSLHASPSKVPSSTVSSSETTTTCMLTRATWQKQRKCDALDAQSWHSHYPLTQNWHLWRENNVNSVFVQTVYVSWPLFSPPFLFWLKVVMGLATIGYRPNSCLFYSVKISFRATSSRAGTWSFLSLLMSNNDFKW